MLCSGYDDPTLLRIQMELHALRHESLLLKRDHLLDQYLRSKASETSALQGQFNQEQPRVPAGTPEGGQWASGGWHRAEQMARQRESMDGRDLVEPAFAGPLGRYGIQKTFELGIALYGLWSQQNGPDNQTVLKFRALEYPVDKQGSLQLEGVQSLTQEEVARACPRFQDVQQRVNETTERLTRENPDLSLPVLGTKIHKDVERQIKALGDPDYAAERSSLKGIEGKYGVAGTVRIDALELSRPSTVCVYDIKTGKSGLSFARMLEISGESVKAFGPGARRIIVAEVRPSS